MNVLLEKLAVARNGGKTVKEGVEGRGREGQGGDRRAGLDHLRQDSHAAGLLQEAKRQPGANGQCVANFSIKLSSDSSHDFSQPIFCTSKSALVLLYSFPCTLLLVKRECACIHVCMQTSCISLFFYSHLSLPDRLTPPLSHSLNTFHT